MATSNIPRTSICLSTLILLNLCLGCSSSEAELGSGESLDQGETASPPSSEPADSMIPDIEIDTLDDGKAALPSCPENAEWSDLEQGCLLQAEAVPVSCDDTIEESGDDDPVSAARALGLCQLDAGSSDEWGLIRAQYTRANGKGEPAELTHGLLERFGSAISPTEGSRLLALSTGTARDSDDPEFASPDGVEHGYKSDTPEGFSAESESCPGIEFETKAYDSVALELELRTPSNAKTLSFDFNFFTYEFPNYICSEFNDFFVVLMDPAPDSAVSRNISFDNVGNPVSVNNGFLEVCKAQKAGGKDFPCAQGSEELEGTGFEHHASTGWLNTSVPVEGDTIYTLRFMIWDAGDPVLDSTALIDNLRFTTERTVEPQTRPVVR